MLQDIRKIAANAGCDTRCDQREHADYEKSSLVVGYGFGCGHGVLLRHKIKDVSSGPYLDSGLAVHPSAHEFTSKPKQEA
jgi:hypothetical protein